jgi:tetratricopeptide (TPR) repeat protein
MNWNRRVERTEVWLATVLAAILFLTPPAGADNPPPVAADKFDAAFTSRIDKLIEQLGANDFALREKAQSELAQAGLEAYDALHAAQSHHDPEIALRARYLVRSMSVRWFSDADSPKVVAILKDYGDLQEPERSNRIDRLAALENGLGVTPLVRLARFETMDPLAKYAALQVMQLPSPAGDAQAELVKNIQAVVGNSNRVGASWLRLYARTLVEPLATLSHWDQATQAEQALFAKHPERSSREVVRDLYRYQVELLKRLDRDEEAIAVMRRTFALLDGTPEQVQEVVDWLVHRQAWSVALEVLQKFEPVVADKAELLYLLVNVQDQLGNAAQAHETAQRALALKPENLDDHMRIGRMLEETRGMEKWAEAEYRQVLANATPASRQDFVARFKLAELLHDRLRELPAAQMLKPVCDLLAKDATAKETWERHTLLPPEAAIARMNYFLACHDREQQDHAQEQEHLQAAVNSYPEDADVLIAMYRLPNADDAWKKLTKEKIEAVAAEFRRAVENSKVAVEGADNEHSRAEALRLHAIDCNQLAWLVGNTFGDYQEAVKLSQESVKICEQLPLLKPSTAGYLDTLGRCYYAAGDLPNAVKHQSLAATLNPVSGQIRRQLEFFQQEAADRGLKLP